jgi:hypothetical protein
MNDVQKGSLGAELRGQIHLRKLGFQTIKIHTTVCTYG